MFALRSYFLGLAAALSAGLAAPPAAAAAVLALCASTSEACLRHSLVWLRAAAIISSLATACGGQWADPAQLGVDRSKDGKRRVAGMGRARGRTIKVCRDPRRSTSRQDRGVGRVEAGWRTRARKDSARSLAVANST